MIYWITFSENNRVAVDRDPSELTVYSLTIHYVGRVVRFADGAWLACTPSDDGRLFDTEAEARAWVEERVRTEGSPFPPGYVRDRLSKLPER